MENKHLRKQILLALVPVIALSLIVLFNTVPKSFFDSGEEGSLVPTIQSEYAAEEQKQDAPSQEPIYISIFKFIVNCNPFQKETQL